MTKDLTRGSVAKTLLLFALPMLIGNIFQQLYNIADTIIVGRKIGPDAIGAVGVSFPIVFLLIAVSMGIGIGCSVIVSQLFGAKKLNEIKKASYTALICATICGIVFTVVGASISKPILEFLKTPANIMNMSVEYLKIIFYGSLFVFIYNVSTSIFNALGNSKTPLVFLIISAVLNIFLDLYCIVNLKMGVAGAAVATIISQGIAALLAVVYLIYKLHNLNSEKVDKIFDLELLKTMSKIALPSMLQQSFVSLGMMALQGVVNTFGSDVVAGFTAACKIDSIAMMPILNISNALATFAAQNMGARKIQRVKDGLKASMIASVIFSIIIAFLIFNFGELFIQMFLEGGQNAAVIAFGVEYLKKICIYYVIMAVFFNTASILRGAGVMKSFVTSSIMNMVTRIIFAYSMVGILGKSTIWYSIVAGWVLGGIISTVTYLKGNWQNVNVVSEDIEEIEAETETNTMSLNAEDYA